MIREISIRNFKCFKHLKVVNCGRINVIVGDNGVGKTAFLEAVFLALGMTTDLVVRFRQARGLDGSFRGSARRVADALLLDLFHQYNSSEPIAVELVGDGPEARKFTILRRPMEEHFLLSDPSAPPAVTAPFKFIWTDSEDGEHSVIPKITQAGLEFPETGEDLRGFFFFQSNQSYSSTENADRYSELSRFKREQRFVQLFKKEYPWIEDLSIEIIAGNPSIFASVKGLFEKIPISNVSSGISRIMTFLLAIAIRERSVVLVDEIDNGLYHTHYVPYWQALLSFAREFNSQLFVSTHSLEWISALIEAAGDQTEDIVLWQAERTQGGTCEMVRTTGDRLRLAIEYNTDPR